MNSTEPKSSSQLPPDPIDLLKRKIFIQKFCFSTHQDLISLCDTDEKLKEHKSEIDRIFNTHVAELTQGNVQDMVDDLYVSTYKTITCMEANQLALTSAYEKLNYVSEQATNWADNHDVNSFSKKCPEWALFFADVVVYLEKLKASIPYYQDISRVCMVRICDCIEALDKKGVSIHVIESLLDTIHKSVSDINSRSSQTCMLLNMLFHLCTKVNLCLQSDPTQSKPEEHLLDLLRECEKLTVTKKDHNFPLFNSSGGTDDFVSKWNQAKELLKNRLTPFMKPAQESSAVFDRLLQSVCDIQSETSASVLSAYSAIDLIRRHHPNGSGLMLDQVNGGQKNQKTSCLHDVDGMKSPSKKQKTSGCPGPTKKCAPQFEHACRGKSSGFRLRLKKEMKVTYTSTQFLFCPERPPDPLFFKKDSTCHLENLPNTQKIRLKLYNAETAINFFLKKCGIFEGNESVVVTAIDYMCHNDRGSAYHQNCLASEESLKEAFFKAFRKASVEAAINSFLEKCGIPKGNESVGTAFDHMFHRMFDADGGADYLRDCVASAESLVEEFCQTLQVVDADFLEKVQELVTDNSVGVKDLKTPLNIGRPLKTAYQSLLDGHGQNSLCLLCSARVAKENAKSIPNYKWRLEFQVFHPESLILLPFAYEKSSLPAGLEFPKGITDHFQKKSGISYVNTRVNDNVKPKDNKGWVHHYKLLKVVLHTHAEEYPVQLGDFSQVVSL